MLVHVVRPGVHVETDHVAETLMIKPDVTIVNDGTIEEFLEKIDALLFVQTRAA